MSDEDFLDLYTDTNSTSTPSPPPEIYVRSEYAPAYGLSIEKTYTNLTSDTLHG